MWSHHEVVQCCGTTSGVLILKFLAMHPSIVSPFLHDSLQCLVCFRSPAGAEVRFDFFSIIRRGLPIMLSACLLLLDCMTAFIDAQWHLPLFRPTNNLFKVLLNT